MALIRAILIGTKEKFMTCNADNIGKALFSNLIAGEDFSIPEVDFSDPKWALPASLESALQSDVKSVELEDLTERRVGGDGSVDALVEFASAHLKEEFDKGRITGAEYTKAYTSIMTAAMQTGLQFLLQRDAVRWAGITAQIQALTTRVNLETAKAQFIAAKASVRATEAQYANQVIDLSIKDSNYCISQYNLNSVLPQQLILTKEQTEAARAQTMDTRTDGSPVRGSVGKQKDLYTQQITSYQRSSEINAAQMFKDAWIAHKSIDEGIDTPASFNANSISQVLASIKSKNGL